MAIVIKSNVAANDPLDLLPIYTPYGISKNQEVVIFADDLGEQGYTLKSNEFAAFEQFVGKLKEKEVWSKVIEVYPIVGNGIDSAGVKLASKTVASKMTPVGDFTVDNLEIDSGIVIGKKMGNSVTGVSRNGGMNTHLKASALNKGFGLHVYTQSVAVIEAEMDASRSLWGASQIGDASSGTYVSAIAGASTIVPFRVAYRGGFTAHTINTQGGGVLQAVASVNAIGSLSTLKTVFNGVSSEPKVEAVVIGADLDRDLYLFARNGYAVNNDVYGQYNAAVRFGMLTDGTVSEHDNTIIRSEILSLMSKLGRVFV